MVTQKPLSHFDSASLVLCDAVGLMDKLIISEVDQIPLLIEIAKAHALLAIHERLKTLSVHANVNILE